MIIRRIAILGGAGFVGRTLANRLSGGGYRVRIATRDREARRHDLILLPEVDLVEADIHDAAGLLDVVDGCDAVVNLVGILNEKGRDGTGFRRVHVELAQKIVDACRQAGIRRLLQMSALNADALNGPSHYLRTKGEAEDLLHAAPGLSVTSFRPSVIFGRGDAFFNRFAGLLHLSPLVFPLACAGARFAPVYVGDVAEAMARSLTMPETGGRRLQLCGPGVHTLRELVEFTAQCCGMRRRVIPLSDFLSRLQARVFDFVPGKPFSMDNYLSATVDSVCSCNALPELGITPTAVEAVVPDYLAGGRRQQRLSKFRNRAGGPGA
jgi:uncharacterized protein YbjT (DUF2867 family)